jgi:hypothetical protein
LAQLPARSRGSLMVGRIHRGLELFNGRGGKSEVGAYLSAQSDVDANRVMGSYALLKVFLWAIPILGFIGTVLGLSVAMQNFGSADLADMNQLKKSVSDITGGLATAFNTTLLGLVLSMILMFPMSALQKREDDMLTDIDAFCSGNLLPRLDDRGASAHDEGTEAAPEEFYRALVEHSAILRDAAEKFEGRFSGQDAAMREEFAKSLEKITETATKSISENVKATGSYFNALREGIAGLNTVLEELGSKQVVIQQPKKKKGWF